MNSIFSSSDIESFQKWKCKRRRKLSLIGKSKMGRNDAKGNNRKNIEVKTRKK